MALPPRRKRATIGDVARVARVSHQTVSRVINGEHCIAPETRTMVERATAALAFGPSHIARSLVSRSTKTIGLVMGDVASPFFPEVVRGAEDVLSEAGYCLILSNSSRDPQRELRNVRHLLERSTDGLILGAPQSAPDELRDLAERAAVPMVFLNRDVKGAHVASVWIDWRAPATAGGGGALGSAGGPPPRGPAPVAPRAGPPGGLGGPRDVTEPKRVESRSADETSPQRSVRDPEGGHPMSDRGEHEPPHRLSRRTV